MYAYYIRIHEIELMHVTRVLHAFNVKLVASLYHMYVCMYVALLESSS